MGRLRRLVESVVSIGIGNVVAVLRYTRERKRLERRYPPPAPFPWLWPRPEVGATVAGAADVAAVIAGATGAGGGSTAGPDGPGGPGGSSFAETWADPGQVAEVVATPRGARVRFAVAGAETGTPATTRDHGPATLDLSFLAPDLIEVTWRAPLAGLPLPERDWPEVDVNFIPAPPGEGWILRTAALEVHLAPDARLSFFEPGGRLLREEWPPLFAGENVCHRVRLAAGERLHGLGERAAPVDLRGGTYRMWNRDPGGAYGPGADPVYLSIPIYLSRTPAEAGPDGIGASEAGYLVFYANSHPAAFDLGKTDPSLAEHRFAGGGLRYYFIPGPAARVLERYADLTGKPALPPLWAFGYHQCRWSYYPEARVRKLAADFARHDIPVDAIHLDIHYMDGYRVFTVDKTRFPDLAGLAKDLAAQGIRLVTICDPGVKRDPGYFLYREGLEEKAFCTLPDGEVVIAPVWPGPCAFPDFSRPAVREWWGRQYGRLLEASVAGFWQDMNEPATFVAAGEPTLPLACRHALGDHRAVHNLYGLFMNQAAYEGLRRLDPERRPFIVSRSGWAGLQRYAWTWTADVRSDWACLRQTIATIIGLGLSGIPFSGSDVGGFNGEATPELYIRWLQASAFMPFFRSHTMIGTPDQEPWSYGEPYTTIARDFIRLRYSLLPYIYTLAWEAAEKGWPMVRPLFWSEAGAPASAPTRAPAGAPARPATRESPDDDTFLLGDSLLVAPVTEEGATSREVPVPAGLWYDFWTDRPLRGPAMVRLDAPLGRIPVLVRAGAVLPREEPASSTGARGTERLSLHLYPPEVGASGAGHLYTDRGDGYGPGRLDRFVVTRRQGTVELRWVESERGFPWPYRRTEVTLHGVRDARGSRSVAPSSVWVCPVEDL